MARCIIIMLHVVSWISTCPRDKRLEASSMMSEPGMFVVMTFLEGSVIHVCSEPCLK